MSRDLIFHYARPDAQYDGWTLIGENGGRVGEQHDGPFGVMWHVEFDEDPTAFSYRLQRDAAEQATTSDSTTDGSESGSAKGGQQTDPNKRWQELELAQDHTEVVYPSGFAKGGRAHTLAVSSPDGEHQAIREKLEQMLGEIAAVRGAITTVDSTVTGLDAKTDDLGVAVVAVADRLGRVDAKTDDLGVAVVAVADRLGKVDAKTDTVHDATVVIHDEVGRLLGRAGVIIVSPQPHPPGDVEQLVGQALPIVDDVIASLDTARTTYASAVHVPAVPLIASPGDSRGQAVQSIIEHVYFAQLAIEAERDRLRELAGDDAAMGAQDLVALRAQLIATTDQIGTELEQVETLAQADPTDLELLKTLRDEVLAKLIELRVLAAGVSP
jgi:hypothetical protein